MLWSAITPEGNFIEFQVLDEEWAIQIMLDSMCREGYTHIQFADIAESPIQELARLYEGEVLDGLTPEQEGRKRTLEVLLSGEEVQWASDEAMFWLGQAYA